MSETKNTFPSLVNRYLLDYLPLKRNTTPNTIIAYQNSFQTFKEFIEVKKHKKFINLEMEDFTREFLFDYVTWLKEEKGNSDGTCHLRLSAIKAFLQYCSDENPAYCLQCKEAKTVRIKRIQPDISKLGALPPEKIERLLSAPDPSTPIGLRDQCLLRLLYQTGCRINEVLSLKLRDLIRRNKMVTLRIYGKGGEYRTVPLVKSTTKILDKYLNSYHPENNLDDLVFYSFRKGIKTKLSQNTVGYRLDKYCQLLHEKDPSFPEHIHAHQLRHSIATTLYKQGVDITTIRDLLGHASVETTKIYAKSDLTMIKEALDKVEVTEKNASQKKIWKGKEEFIKKLWQ